jgi:hypothetical protein
MVAAARDEGFGDRLEDDHAKQARARMPIADA